MKKVQKNSWSYLLAILIVIFMYNFYQRGSDQYIVTRVIDGDTIELRNGEKVRYIGIDTPERHHPRKDVEYFAQEAYKANRQMVENKKVKLEFDVQQKDRYGRLLAYVYTEDGIMINEWLVANGYARVATFPPNVRYVDRFLRLEQEAREQNIGLWSK